MSWEHVRNWTMKLTQRENAYRHIRHKVTTGLFPAGQRLYPAALAREIGVSLIPVREAIGQLQSEGLVVQRPRRGVFVKEIERRDLVDLVEFRTTLECAAAAAAARRINSTQLKELDRLWHDLRRAAERFHVPPGSELDDRDRLLEEWHAADLAFHMLLFRAAGNRRAIRAIEDTHVMIRMFAGPAVFTVRNLQVHRDIYEAIGRHDPTTARRAMHVHMRRAGKRLIAHYDRLQRHADVDEAPAGDLPNSTR
jgi:DNA-binding GntR family transcriptional regulator